MSPFLSHADLPRSDLKRSRNTVKPSWGKGVNRLHLYPEIYPGCIDNLLDTRSTRGYDTMTNVFSRRQYFIGLVSVQGIYAT